MGYSAGATLHSPEIIETVISPAPDEKRIYAFMFRCSTWGGFVPKTFFNIARVAHDRWRQKDIAETIAKTGMKTAWLGLHWSSGKVDHRATVEPLDGLWKKK